jgi:DNA-binding CsgD family transcriptional regulator/DNA-binding Xre family transcriptional regulator
VHELIASPLLGGPVPEPDANHAEGEPAELSYRELQVLRRIARGLSNRDIGRDLEVSEDTVKTYARRMFRKLGVTDRAHAVAVGYHCGLLGGHGDSHDDHRVLFPLVLFVRAADLRIRQNDAPVPRMSELRFDADVGGLFARIVGRVLRIVRERRGWYLRETGGPAGMSVSMLSRTETGHRSMDLERLADLCVSLGVAPADVVALAQRAAYPQGWPYRVPDTTTDPVRTLFRVVT